MARKKKEVAKEVQKETNIVPEVKNKIPVGVQYAVKVEPPNDTLPPAQEVISASYYVPGSWLYAPEVFEGDHKFITDFPNKSAICIALIRELDKGNSGTFKDDYFMECDKSAPSFKQFDNFVTIFNKGWKGEQPPSSEVLKAQYGYQMRIYWRSIFFRFMSYYALGYKVTFTVKEAPKA
ncbi:MAG: hypothetical protein WC511_02890 [Candidatus Pacearchaeota archaeon]